MSTGWNVERFIKNPDTLADFVCAICREIFRDASTLNCGHTFCERCSILSEFTNKCSLCREFITQRVPDFSKRMLINRLQISCVFKSYGCSHTDTLKFIEAHEETCPYRLELCELCDEEVSINTMAHHLTNECEYRSVTCAVCNNTISYIETEMHAEVCPMSEVECVFCKWNGKRHMLSEHDLICPDFPVLCAYDSFGCKVLCTRTTINNHESNSLAEHLKLVTNFCTKKFKIADECMAAEGPFRVEGHLHSVMLCSDLTNSKCNMCHNTIKCIYDNPGELWLGYRCTKGCNYNVCLECLPKKRLYKSKHLFRVLL